MTARTTEENPGIVGVDHVQLAAPVGSEEKARDFYVAILGLKEIPKPSSLQRRGGVWFQVGLHELHIGIEDPKNFHPSRKAHPAFEVKDVGKLRQMLVSKGIRVRDDEPLPYADRFYADDPFGNRLEFLQKKNQRTGTAPRSGKRKI